MSRRKLRVASAIRQELAMMILRELNDPRLTGFPSITRVTVADDLATADIYVTVMGTPGQQNAALNALRHSAGLMRTRLVKVLSMRITPFLQFHLDEDLKRELELDALLRKVELENAELDQKRAAEGGSVEAGDEGDDAAPGVDAAAASEGAPEGNAAPGNSAGSSAEQEGPASSASPDAGGSTTNDGDSGR